MLMFALALLPTAQAYVVACMPYVVGTLPSASAEFVPTDVRPVAFFAGGTCAEDWRFTAQLADADGEVVAEATVESSIDAPAPFVALEPPEPLLPNAAYVLLLAPEGVGVPTMVAFSTGEGSVEPLAGWPPELSITSAGRGRSGGAKILSATGVLDGEEDLAGLSSFVVFDEAELPVAALPADTAGLGALSASWLVSEAGRELCLTAAQVDGAGRMGARSEPACARSCASAPAPAGYIAGLLAALLLRGRRA